MAVVKVDGVTLREALRRWNARRDLAAKQFNDSLFAFEGENKSAYAVGERFNQADDAVARLQSLQQEYNQGITFDFGHEPITLAFAIKRIGGLARLAKMWRSAAADTGGDRWSRREMIREAGKEMAKKVVSDEDCLTKAVEFDGLASQLRAAIARANMTEMELTVANDLVAELLTQ